MAAKRGIKNYISQGGAFSLFLLLYLLIPIVLSVYASRSWESLGNGIFAGVFGVYFLCSIICGISVPAVLGRLIKIRLLKNAIKDARSMQRRAFVYCIFFGVLFGCALFFFAGRLSAFFLKGQLGEFPFQIIAVGCLFCALCCFFRGYFIGHGAMLILGTSMLLEQILDCVLGITFMRIFKNNGIKVSNILRDSEYSASFETAGMMAGIVISLIVTFIFLFIVYIATHGYFRKAYGKDAGRLREDTLSGGYSFLSALMPSLGILVMVLGSVFFEQLVYKISPTVEDGEVLRTLVINWGIYDRQYKMLVLVPMAIALVMCRVPANLMAKQGFAKDSKKRRGLTAESLKAILLTVVPFSVCIGLGSDILTGILYPGMNSDILIKLLKTGFISIIFYAAALLFFALLWEDGRRVSCLLGILVPFVIKLVFELLFVKTLSMGINSFAFGDIVFSLLLMLAGGLLASGAGLLKKGFLREYIPVCAAFAAISLVVFVLDLLLKRFADSPTAIILYLVIAAVSTLVFYIIILLFHGVNTKVLSYIPGGGIIITIGRIIGFL